MLVKEVYPGRAGLHASSCESQASRQGPPQPSLVQLQEGLHLEGDHAQLLQQISVDLAAGEPGWCGAGVISGDSERLQGRTAGARWPTLCSGAQGRAVRKCQGASSRRWHVLPLPG